MTFLTLILDASFGEDDKERSLPLIIDMRKMSKS